MSEGIRPFQSEEQERIEKASTEMILSAKNLNELYQAVKQLAVYEKQGNEAAQSFGDLKAFFASELAKLGALLDSVNGTSSSPQDPNTLDEAMAAFPDTALGVISERCSIRAQAGQFLTELVENKAYETGNGPDIVIP